MPGVKNTTLGGDERIDTYSLFKSQYGELIIGSYEHQLCLCDWPYRKMRTTIDRRIQKGLDAAYVKGESEVSFLLIFIFLPNQANCHERNYVDRSPAGPGHGRGYKFCFPVPGVQDLKTGGL